MRVAIVGILALVAFVSQTCASTVELSLGQPYEVNGPFQNETQPQQILLQIKVSGTLAPDPSGVVFNNPLAGYRLGLNPIGDVGYHEASLDCPIQGCGAGLVPGFLFVGPPFFGTIFSLDYTYVSTLYSPDTNELNSQLTVLPKGAIVNVLATLPDGYSITAVPEPSTWAMLLIGFAGIGFMLYRRRDTFALV